MTSKEIGYQKKVFASESRSILINVDLISIGLTLPYVDSIMFAEEISIESLIVQRAFRCLTFDKENPNKVGKILLPVASVDSALGSLATNFKKNSGGFAAP